MSDDSGSKGGGVIFEILPGGKKHDQGYFEVAHEVGVANSTKLFQELLARQADDATATDRTIVIVHGRGGSTFRMAGPMDDGGLPFYDAVALFGICQMMLQKLMATSGVI